jgi:O-antigen/teichoic acid export membrane protein
MSSDIAGRVVRNIFFSGVRLAVGTGAAVCTSAIIARTLGPEATGVYSYAMWLVGAVGAFANLGMPAAITKYVSEYLGRGDAEAAIYVGKRLLIAQVLVALGVSGLSACLAFLITPYRGIVVLVAIMMFAQSVQKGLAAALAGVQRFDRLALIGLYVGLAQVTAVGVAAYMHAGVVGMLWATLSGLAVSAWLCYRAACPFLSRPAPGDPLSTHGGSKVFRGIAKFSITISYILILDTIIWQRSEVLFLKWYSTLPEIAFYTLAYSITAKLNDVASTFSSALLPFYSESFGRNGLQDLAPAFVNAVRFLQMVMVPLCMLGIAVARPLVGLVYGTRYLPLVLPLQLLYAALAFTSTGVVGSPLLVGTQKQAFIAKYGTAIAILNVSLDLLLIPRHGALGAAMANCAAQIAGVLGGTIYVVRYVGARFPWRTTATVYFAAAVGVAPVALCLGWERGGAAAFVGSLVIGAALYFCILVVTGELGRGDFGALRGALSARVYQPKSLRLPDTV